MKFVFMLYMNLENMKIRLAAVFLIVVQLSVEISAEDVKRGTYPYMAFIYYQDERIKDLSGSRFLQGAVLIRPSYLISSSPESTISHDPLSKTLLARLGANIIDAKFSLNEDEDEQEREVIQITRPHGYNSSQWWATDITIMKTLQPFESTKAVHVAQLFKKDESNDKTCQILVFQKKSNSDIRFLTRRDVEMLPASTENCGGNFVEKYMACATEASSEEQLPANFCHGNSGGPLICNDDNIIGLQTYINGSCNAPYLYQLLASRKHFLYCGTDEKCGTGECQDVCSVTLKDPVPTVDSTTLSTEETTTKPTTALAETNEPPKLTEPPILTEPSESTESTLSEISVPTTTTLNLTEVNTDTTTWPMEKEPRRMNVEEEDLRPVKMEAQKETHQTPLRHSGANANMVVFQSFVYSGFFLCICLM